MNILKNIFALALFSIPLSAHAVVVAFEEDHGLPLVHLNIALKAGSAQDPRGQSGLTNFMGEMLLRGTRTKTKEQVDLALDQMGAHVAVETRAEAMILRATVLSSQVEPFLKLMSEIVTEPSFPDAELRKLKGEITSGILQELADDSTLAQRRFTRQLFPTHPYGNPVLGISTEVEKFTRTAVINQYDRVVRDELLLVVGAGEASSTAVDAWAKQLAATRTGMIPRNAPAAPALAPMPVDPPSRRYVLIDKPDRTQTQVYAGHVGVRMTDPDFFPLYLGNHAFGGGSFSARLMVEIRVKRGWSYGAYSYFRHGLRPRSWQTYSFPATKDTPAAVEETIKLIASLQERGVTPEEFGLAQSSLVNSAGFSYDTPKKRVENILLERTLDLPAGFMKSYGTELAKVTLPQVNSALAKFVKPNRLTILVLGTAKDLKAPLAQALGIDAKSISVLPYTSEAVAP